MKNRFTYTFRKNQKPKTAIPSPWI